MIVHSCCVFESWNADGKLQIISKSEHVAQRGSPQTQYQQSPYKPNNRANSLLASQSTAPHQVFVGDLPAHLTEDGLRDYFSAFGPILDCRVIRDPLTQKSKCFGFVRFANNQDAEAAISSTNEMTIDGRKIRSKSAIKREPNHPLSFEQVLVQASPYNTTIYIGGLGYNFNAEFVRAMCAMYGALMEMRLFQDKGYAFVRYASRESAAAAILGINNSEISGHHVRCSWGKETRDPHLLRMSRNLTQNCLDPANSFVPQFFPALTSVAQAPTSGWSPAFLPHSLPVPIPHPTQIAANIGNYHISFPYAASQFYPM